MSTVQSLVQSRWGFHPCDYTTFRKLKFLNLICQQAVRSVHAWLRWKRKDPHNRVVRRRIRNEKGQTIGYERPTPIAEPRICTVFSEKVYEKCYVDKKGSCFKDGFLDDKVVMNNHRIAEDYASARRPTPQSADVRPLHYSAVEIDELYEKARDWMEERDVG